MFELLNPNGYLIADNVLWDGKVVDPVRVKRKFNQRSNRI